MNERWKVLKHISSSGMFLYLSLVFPNGVCVCVCEHLRRYFCILFR